LGLQGWTGANPTLKFSSRAASQRYAQVIDITNVHLDAEAALVHPLFFCAANHPTEPGWGTG
jgi:hypothetical protein